MKRIIIMGALALAVTTAFGAKMSHRDALDWVIGDSYNSTQLFGYHSGELIGMGDKAPIREKGRCVALYQYYERRANAGKHLIKTASRANETNRAKLNKFIDMACMDSMMILGNLTDRATIEMLHDEKHFSAFLPKETPPEKAAGKERR